MSKGQRSGSQGHKVQKHIEGDRVEGDGVAGVSLHFCQVFMQPLVALVISVVSVCLFRPLSRKSHLELWLH